MKTGVSSRLILVFNRTQTILPWQPSGRYTVTHFQENQTKAGGMEEVFWSGCLVISSLPIGPFRNWQNFELLILPLALLGCHQIPLLHSPLLVVTEWCCFSSEQSQEGLGHQTLKRAPRSYHKPGFQRRNKVLVFFFYTSFFLYYFLLGCWPSQWPHQLALFLPTPKMLSFVPTILSPCA